LTALLFRVMVTVVGWASKTITPLLQGKPSLTFRRGSLHSGPLLMPSDLLIVRELGKPEAQFPRMEGSRKLGE
jgi:hypothetical protein